MSLDVKPALQEQAQRGDIDEGEFVDCVRTSLPYAWDLITRLVRELHSSPEAFADNRIPPPDEQARGQLLRALASDSIREALERHFEVKLAFQNCHRVAVFRPGHADGDVYRRFVSPRAQVLNQTPELRNC